MAQSIGGERPKAEDRLQQANSGIQEQATFVHREIGTGPEGRNRNSRSPTAKEVTVTLMLRGQHTQAKSSFHVTDRWQYLTVW